MCSEIINGVDSVSTNVTFSISSDDEKVRYKIDYYILNTFLLAAILLFITALICYHCAKHR